MSRKTPLTLLVAFLIFSIQTASAEPKAKRVDFEGESILVRDLSTPCDGTTAAWKKRIKRRDCSSHPNYSRAVETEAGGNAAIVALPTSTRLTPEIDTRNYLLTFDPEADPARTHENEHVFIKVLRESSDATSYSISVGSSFSTDDNESSLIQAGYIKDRLIANGVSRDAIRIDLLDSTIPVGRALIAAWVNQE